jgi:hypothetical protein
MSTFVHRAYWLAALCAIALAGGPAFAADTSRQCLKAQRKVTKEENWAVRGEAMMERDRKAREGCATDAVCGRYDARLHEMEKRKSRHESRLARFKADAAKACSSG